MSRKVGIILTAIIAVIVGLWMWAGIIPKNSTQIGGSTSVDPLMQRLTNTYRKEPNSNTFIYASCGSTGGVNNAKSGTYKIGFISRALDETITGVQPVGSIPKAKENSTYGEDIYQYFLDDSTKYSGDTMHYVQIATDAIILTYDAPTWFADNFSPYFTISLDANGQVSEEWQKTIQGIYGGNYTWIDVANDIKNNPENKNNADIQKLVTPTKTKKTPTITPFAREPGSGTRSSFDNMFGLKGTGHPSKAFEYNSNGMMYNNFREDTFGYMSLNYLGQIKNNKKLEVVSVKNTSGSVINPKKISDDDFIKDVSRDEYPLTRPYIGLIKADLKDSDLNKIANFLAWISLAKNGTDQQKAVSDSAYQQYVKAGLAPEFKLDSTEIKGEGKMIIAKPKATSQNETLISTKATIREGYLPRQ